MKTLAALLALTATVSANPLMDGADPHAMVIGKDYWMFPTEANTREPIFAAYRSPDLREWKREGAILNLNDIPWIKENGAPSHKPWAPSMAEKDGRFYFYYSVGPQSEQHPSRIGVASSDSPTGPFKDSGKPLLTGGNGFEAIDPMVFTDPASKKSYFYAGGSAGSTLRVFEMAEDMVNFTREIKTTTPPHFTEGAFLHLHEGTYYLSYSHGPFNTAAYSVHYATSDSPEGPWKYRGRVLESDASHQGPGHHAFVMNPSNGEWFIIYHRWETPEKKGTYRGNRKIAVERIHYQKDGGIAPIPMTDADSPVSPIK